MSKIVETVFKKSVPQESFHAHLQEQSHNEMDDWQFILINEAENVEQVRRKPCSQYELCTFVPDGLNERNILAIF